MHAVTTAFGLAGLLLSAGFTSAIDLDIDDPDSIISASKVIKDNILALYKTSDLSMPGVFPSPYYWWESGLAWDSLINYWALSGDDSVVQTIQDGVLWQVGPNYDFMPPNQTKSEGNDDQATWALAAMTAAEQGFPLPSTSNVSWVQLAQNVFDDQALRWDDSTCDGGLRWQIFTFNNGYNYKNTASAGSFLQLAARLARYTGNSTYSDWAQKTVEWSYSVGLVDRATGSVFDGTDVNTNCSALNHIQWTQSFGLYIGGGAYMSNLTSDTFWSGLVQTILSRAKTVFTADSSNVLYESACAPEDNCNTDQLSFRTFLARALADVRDLTTSSNGTSTQQISAILKASAQGAAAQCSGGESGTACGSDWTKTKWDGTQGLSQDLSALAIILANLPTKELRTVNSTGNGTSTTNPTTGGNSTAPTTGPSHTIVPANAAQSLVSGSIVSSLVAAGIAGVLCSLL